MATKAHSLAEIDAALDKFAPIEPTHEFYVDFQGLRGDFQDRRLLNMLNVEKQGNRYTYNHEINRRNKTFLFLAGMRGSGKTTELARYAQMLNNPDCFFCVTCNIDTELDMNNVQYMDIVVFQLEKLIDKADQAGVRVKDSILTSMNQWFQERVVEINRTLKAEGSAEMEIEPDKSALSLLKILLGFTVKLKTGLSGSAERANKIRENLKNRFSDFAKKINEFIEHVNIQLREQGLAKEILFIVDGLEKTMSADTRRQIIMDESNRIQQIKANTIFTLPIELMKEEQRIRNFASDIITFPFIKVQERDGERHLIEKSVQKFEEFVYKRIDANLFGSPETVRLAIQYSGGSPRQLLSILEMANWEVPENESTISMETMKRALQRRSNQTARYIEPQEFELLKALRKDLEDGKDIGFSNAIQDLLEKGILFEYNDGTYKCVNPLVEISKLYKQYVLSE